MKIARVALDVPLSQLFDYRTESDGDSLVGQRVLVPFGKRHAVGVVVELARSSELPDARLKRISRVLDDARPFSAEDLKLLRFAGDYYHYPLGQVVMNALPQRLRRAAPPPARAVAYQITQAGLQADAKAISARALLQRRILLALQAERVLTSDALREIAPSAHSAVKALIERGWVQRGVAAPQPTPAEAPDSVPRQTAPYALTGSQARAVEEILAAVDNFHAFLLLGVTGSGKTEVYLRAAETVLSRGRQVLLLVPEIALTPQLQAMLQARFPEVCLVTLHSGLNETERLQNWLAAQSGEARLVLGTRLAVFAPLPRLGLVIVDEEHDPSFKQTEGFCYSARDLAVVRASQRGIPIVLGSATPALETYQNASTGRYRLLELPERINERPPRIQCVTIDPARTHRGLAPQMLAAIEERLRRREQTLVFINRRGYAPVLMCHSCGWLSGCHRCSAQLVLHLPARELHCHHCGHRAAVPPACPTCGNPALSPIGQGTQRVEDALVRHFPEAKVLRVDRDSTRGKGVWSGMRERIEAREVDILVGTQILAKGHDFAHLALVCILNADGMLYSADFRASERLYALLTQVAGRAGRAESQGEVLIQTEFPDHPLYAALRDQDVHRFLHQLLAQRGVGGFPPFVHQALLRAEAPQLETALEYLEDAKRAARGIEQDVELFDAVPAAMVRLAGRARAQLLVQSASRPALHVFLRQWTARLSAPRSSSARWALDVDPLEL
jgi:primosomal protein N' (replication factor Y) (superfamily II helicase)